MTRGLRSMALALFGVVATPLVFAQTADLSLSIQPGTSSPSFEANTFIDFTVSNNGPDAATGVTVDAALPTGLTFFSDLSGGDYNSATGLWTVPGTIPSGGDATLRLIARVQTFGDFTIEIDLQTSGQGDPDSTPGNNDVSEDDFATTTLTPITPPPVLFCLGRPITPLNFENPIGETTGADPNAPALGDVFRFVGVAPGIDALVEVAAFSGGSSLATIDNTAAGVPGNLQPTLVAGAGEAYADLNINIVETGDTVPGVIDFAGSAIDVDGDNGTMREFVEVSNNIVEFAVNDPTELDVIFPTDPGAPASLPSNRIRFESRTSANAPSISPDVPENIVTAFVTDITTLEYRVGKFGPATGAIGRLNSLAFNCPAITPSAGTTNTFVDEDFTDAPASYSNAIHVIDPTVQLGPTNTDEVERGTGTTASSDAGDDGVPGLPASLTGAVPVTFDVNVSGAGGLLQAFFDWNADGDFQDSGEHAIVDLADTDGDGVIPVTLTPSSSITGPSFARFRWATSSVGVADPAGDGEVEDYAINLVAPAPGDLSLVINAAPPNPFLGNTTTLTIVVRNEGTETVDNIIALVDLPFGIGFVSSDGGANFDLGSGVWNLPTELAPGEIATLQVVASTVFRGSFEVLSEITSAGRPDVDSTPANASTIDEDDSDSIMLIVGTPPAGAAVCPADTVLVTQLGNAVAVQAQNGLPAGNPAADALGPIPIQPPGTNPDTVSAELNNGGDNLIVDLGFVVPENASVTVALARDGGGQGNTTQANVNFAPPSAGDPTVPGAFSLVLRYGNVPAGPNNFVSNTPATQDVIQRIGVNVPAGGVRFIQFDTIGGDDLFVDGVEYSQICVSGGELEGFKTAEVFDPLSEGLFAVPGNDVTYTITVNNIGDGLTDDDSIFLIDRIPDEVIFFNGDADGPGPGGDPVNFQELVPTGLDPFVFADSVRFAAAGPPPGSFDQCGLVPAVGYDPNIGYVCFNPKGIMNNGSPAPSFTLSFRARIR